MYPSLVTGGLATVYSSGRTRPPTESAGDPEHLLRSSREAYGRPLSQTEACFAEFASSNETTAQNSG